MSDTTPDIAVMVARRHADMTPEERMLIASGMFDSARKIVESSLPGDLGHRERRLALIRRLYAGELPEAAFSAFADRT